MGFQIFLSFAPFRPFALVELIIRAQLLRSTGTACEAVSRRLHSHIAGAGLVVHQQCNGLRDRHSLSVYSIAASAWSAVVSKIGTLLSSGLTSSMISVQPRMMASAPASTKRAMTAL